MQFFQHFWKKITTTKSSHFLSPNNGQGFKLSQSQLIPAIFGCLDCSTAQSSRILTQTYKIGPLVFGFRVFVIQTKTCLLKRIVLFMHSQLYYLGFAVVALFFILHLILWFSMSTCLLCKHVQFFVFVCLGKWQKKERTYNTISWVGN